METAPDRQFPIDLSVRLGRLYLKNPIIPASGTFGYAKEYEDLVPLNRLGGLVTKAITILPRPGNPSPRVTETASGMLNAIGLANVGVEAFIAEKYPYLAGLDTAIIVNVAGTTIDDYCRVVEQLEPLERIAALEINISCPNVKEGGISFSARPELARDLAEALRPLTRKPLIFKLSPNVTSVVELAQACVEGGAEILSLINTLIGMKVDIHRRRPVLGNITGGLSGPAIKPVALAQVRAVHLALPDVPLIGMGGIMTWEDAVEFLLVGASAVQVGTAIFRRPQCLMEIIEGLEAYCREQGISRVGELTGSLKV